MTISFVATVFNEEKTIAKLLESLILQSRLSDEIIIVDGGSTDKTKEIILKFIKYYKDKAIRLLIKKGNRSIGRNEGIKNAKGDIILSSDAGCILDKNWIRNIITPFSDPNVDVVAGYYKGLPKSVFQKCLIPYVLVMPDKVNPKHFLPASRTMAFRKKIWEKVGGFPKEYSHNEDYVFAKKLQAINACTIFAGDAIVYWMPRKNLSEVFVMFFRFAFGDAQAEIFRPKVYLVFARYIVGFGLVGLYVGVHTMKLFVTLILLVFAYLVWSVMKNYKYVRDWKAIVILPIIQITADVAVMSGVLTAFHQKIWDIK